MRMSYGAIVLSQDNLAGEHCGDEPFVQNRGGWGVLSVLSMRGAGRGTTRDDQNKEGRGRNERQEHFLFCILSTTNNKRGMGTGEGGRGVPRQMKKINEKREIVWGLIGLIVRGRCNARLVVEAKRSSTCFQDFSRFSPAQANRFHSDSAGLT